MLETYENPAKSDVTVQPGENAKVDGPEVVHAGFWWRLLVAQLDLVLFVALAGVAFSLARIFIPDHWSEKSAAELRLVLLAVLSILYFPLLEARFGATPAKWLFGLRIRDLRGEPVGYVRGVMRHILRVVLVAPFLIGFSFCAFTKRKQAVYDWMMRCVVTRKVGFVLPNVVARRFGDKAHRRLRSVSAMMAAVAAIALFMLIVRTIASVMAPLYEAGNAVRIVRISLASTSTLRSSIGEKYAKDGAFPPEVEQALLLQSGANGVYSVHYVAATGGIKIDYTTNKLLAGGNLMVTPITDAQGAFGWTCHAAGIPSALVPEGCREVPTSKKVVTSPKD